MLNFPASWYYITSYSTRQQNIVLLFQYKVLIWYNVLLLRYNVQLWYYVLFYPLNVHTAPILYIIVFTKDLYTDYVAILLLLFCCANQLFLHLYTDCVSIQLLHFRYYVLYKLSAYQCHYCLSIRMHCAAIQSTVVLFSIEYIAYTIH